MGRLTSCGEWSVRLLVCALVLASSACAKSDLDTHRSVTSQMLTERGAPDFADASTPDYAAIRHTPSGMLCVLPADGAFEFDVFPASAMNAGAQCSSTEGEVVTAWVAVRFREATTLDTAFAIAVGQLNEGLQPQAWEGGPSAADRASPEGLPHYRIHRLEAAFGEEQRYLRLAMSEIDGWYLQQIVSAPVVMAGAAEADAGEGWRVALRAFSAVRQARPTVSSEKDAEG